MSVAVGKNIERVDGYGKVTGQAAYTGDLNIPGMIHGKVLRSPYAHARLVRIDGSKAEQIPGVLAVLTRENCQVATPYIGAMKPESMYGGWKYWMLYPPRTTVFPSPKAS